MGDEDKVVANDPAPEGSDPDIEPATLVPPEPHDPALRAETDETVASLRGLVIYLVENLVDAPEQVSVVADQRGSLVQIQVRLPESELGKVIGRGGRIAKAIRTALMIAGSRHHLRVSLDIES